MPFNFSVINMLGCRTSLLLIMMLLAMSSTSVYSDESFTLAAAYRTARETAPTLLTSKYQVDIAVADRDISRAKSLPQVSLFGQWSENKIEYDGDVLGRYEDRRYPGERYGVQASQRLFSLASWKENSMRSAMLSQTKNAFAEQEARLLFAVSEAYFNVLQSARVLESAETELESLDERLKEAKALSERSLLPITELYEVQARRDTVAADVIGAKGEMLIAEESFSQLVGVRDFSLTSVSSTNLLVPSVGSLEEAISRALERNPTLEAARDAVDAAKFDVEREQGTRWPEVSLSLNSQYSDVGFDNLTSPPRNTESVQISVTLPILEGGAGVARVRRAWATYYTRKTELDAVARETEATVRAAWARLETATLRLHAAKQAVKSSKINLEATKQSAASGIGRFTDILFALANDTRTATDKSHAIHSRALAWLDLELSVGGSPTFLADQFSSVIHRYE